MSDEIEKVPTWGYKGAESKLFELGPDETLPEGWADAPTPTEPIEEPAESAEVATEPSEGEGKDTGEVDALHAEIAGLKSELEQAYARISELEAELLDVEEATETEDDLIEIPDDWAETGPGKHSSRIKLAKQLNPEMADVIEKDADAIEVIEAELAKRG